MKVALINPGVKKYNDTPPINLAMLAACLEKDHHTVTIIDRLSGANLARQVYEFRPDVVGLTGTTPVINDTYACADYCRQLGIRIIIGGIHSTILPHEAIKHADVVITGESEVSLPSVVNDTSLHGIIEATPPQNLDELPMPSYHLLNMEFYATMRQRVELSFLSFAPKTSRVGTPLTSRGCSHSCIFCWNSRRKHLYRARSADKVIEELKLLIDTCGITAIFFIEDNFFFNRVRFKQICEMIINEKLDIIWGANGRVDNINDDVLALAKAAGCKQITFGWESGSQRVLDILKKQTQVEKNYWSVEMCNKYDIIANGTVLIGSPGETEEDIRLTQQFIQKSDIRGGIGVCITTPYPGSALWDWCIETKRIPEQFLWDDFDYQHIPVKICDIPVDRFKTLVKETMMIAATKYKPE